MSSDDASTQQAVDPQPILDFNDKMMALAAKYLEDHPELKMTAWDLTPKGSVLNSREIEELKDRIATHHTNRMMVDPDLLRRLIQTYESMLHRETAGYIEELPEIGSFIHVFVNTRETYSLTVVAHVSKARILVFDNRVSEDSGKIRLLDSWVK